MLCVLNSAPGPASISVSPPIRSEVRERDFTPLADYRLYANVTLLNLNKAEGTICAFYLEPNCSEWRCSSGHRHDRSPVE